MTITLTPRAAKQVRTMHAELNAPQKRLRVLVESGGCSGFQYGMMIEEKPSDSDQVFESNGVQLYVDPVSLSYLEAAEVDFVETVTGGGFTVKNPNATSTCGCGSSFSV